MGIELSKEIRVLVDGPNYAHLATIMRDGSPHVATVWVAREGDRILTGIRGDSIKGRNTRRDPRVALTITDVNDPYSMAQIRGRVVEWRPDPELAGKDAQSHKYVGKPFPWRTYEDGILLVIEADRARYTKVPFTHAPGASR
jgi:PPOX class probable F420-dependent enzyme